MRKAQTNGIGTNKEHPSFETVWAILQEVGIKQEELAESQKETDRIIKENVQQMKETDRIVKENAKKIGNLGDRFGEMVEHMVMPGLVKKFRELGFVFTEANPRTIIDDEENNILTEIDITLQNGDKVMIVEVKSKPTTKDIKEHIKRMEIVKARANLRNDKRIYLGAIAGMVFNKIEKTFALKNGFYVVEPSGEEFVITVPEGIYFPPK